MHLYRVGISCDGLIDAIVNDLMSEVVRAIGISVHTGPLSYRFEAGKYFDCRCGVVAAHGAGEKI
jgi:hypothetical protein